MSGRSQSRSSSFTLQFRWRTGCRVRRHWDQPDHHPDGLQPQPPAPRADQYGQRVRPRVIDLLVDDDHRHPDAGDARRQRRRGQHHGAHHAAAAVRRGAGSSHRHDAGRAGPLRRHSVLRREHDHPRDLARVRSEQPEPRGAGGTRRRRVGADNRRAGRRRVRRPRTTWSATTTPWAAGRDVVGPGTSIQRDPRDGEPWVRAATFSVLEATRDRGRELAAGGKGKP